MNTFLYRFLLLYPSLCCLFVSCKKDFDDSDYSAFFGGEVINPTSNYVLFLKNNEIKDTLFLNEKNRFFIKFDNLQPGLYSFKHEPEFQYIYFDKNDSLMVRMNPVDFDESIVFCGRGDEKNNFLIELYLKNFEDRIKSFDAFDYDSKFFIKNIDSIYKTKEKFYRTKKREIQWSDGFDFYARMMIDLHHFSKKEMYPMAHNMRTGKNILNELPKDFYSYRNNIEYNNENLMTFSPFVRYLSNMLSNISYAEVSEKFGSSKDRSLEMGIIKLNIADTLFKNPQIRDRILDNIAYTYLLEDQNIKNTKKFLEQYSRLATENSQREEIKKIESAIQNLKKGAPLPEITLIDLDLKAISSQSVLKSKSVIFFWTENAETHMASVHKKALEFHKKHPDYQFISINIDDDSEKWRNLLTKYNFSTINHFQAKNFEELKDKWVITKLHRTLILDKKGNIDNAFVNLFDISFSNYLKN